MPAKGSKKDKIAPVKFKAFFDEFEKVVGKDNITTDDEGNEIASPNHNAIIFTDLELVEETNSRLKPKDQITKRTFEGWKKDFIDGNLEPEIAERFFRVYQKALRLSKTKLFNSLVMSSMGWQRFAWIMERKFNEQWGKKEDEGNDKPVPTIVIQKTYDKKKLEQQNK